MMDAQKARYWFEIYSRCRVLDGPAGPSTGELEWYFNQADITRLCDEIEAQDEQENVDLRRQLADKTLAAQELDQALESACAELAKIHQKQPCGHEARFIVGDDEGTNWCALCLLEAHEEAVSSRIKRDLWLDENRAGRSIEEATDERV